MTPEATLALLGRGQVGVLSTSGADGAPYGVPVHYLWQDGKLWFHGLPAGEKLEISPGIIGCALPYGSSAESSPRAPRIPARLTPPMSALSSGARHGWWTIPPKSAASSWRSPKSMLRSFWICPFPRPASPVQPWWKSPLSPSPASITADGFLFPPCPVCPEQGGFPLSRPEKVAIPGGNDYNGVCKSCPGTGAVRGGELFAARQNLYALAPAKKEESGIE